LHLFIRKIQSTTAAAFTTTPKTPQVIPAVCQPTGQTDTPHSCPSAMTASYTAKPKEFYLLKNSILAVLLASSFCNKKGPAFSSHVLQVSKQLMLH